MKKLILESVLCTVALTMTALAVWFYFEAMEKKKTTAQTDLYELLAPQTEALISINRPKTFCNELLAKEEIDRMFDAHVPEVFLRIAGMEDAPQPLLISLHPQGAVLYIRADKKEARRIATHVLKPYFNTYAPQEQNIDGTDFTYYPDAGNRFFGVYEKNGAFVASYSKKLLEATLKPDSSSVENESIDNLRKHSDENAPLNIMIPTGRLNLYVQQNDNPLSAIQNQWLTADLFVSEGYLCCYGSLPYQAEMDSLYAPMADRLSTRLEELFHPIQIDHEINHDGKRIYYIGCENSTLSSSRE